MPRKKSRKACKCAGGAFTYADDSDNLKDMIKDRNYGIGNIMADRLLKSLEDMDKYCGIELNSRTFDHAKEIKEMCEGKTFMDKMNFKESLRMENLLNDIESDVVTKLYRCMRD